MKTYRELGTFAKDFADFGNTPIDGYAILAKHRDSDCLAESNFAVAQQQLAAARSFTTSHWLVGWVEWLYLPEDSAPEDLNAAEALLERLDDYPVLSEDDWSARQDDAAYSFWRASSVSDRVYWCQKGGDSIFAARHPDAVPYGAYDILREEF